MSAIDNLKNFIFKDKEDIWVVEYKKKLRFKKNLWWPFIPTLVTEDVWSLYLYKIERARAIINTYASFAPYWQKDRICFWSLTIVRDAIYVKYQIKCNLFIIIEKS